MAEFEIHVFITLLRCTLKKKINKYIYIYIYSNKREITVSL